MFFVMKVRTRALIYEKLTQTQHSVRERARLIQGRLGIHTHKIYDLLCGSISWRCNTSAHKYLNHAETVLLVYKASYLLSSSSSSSFSDKVIEIRGLSICNQTLLGNSVWYPWLTTYFSSICQQIITLSMEEVVGKLLPGLLASHASPKLLLTSRTSAMKNNVESSAAVGTTTTCNGEGAAASPVCDKAGRIIGDGGDVGCGRGRHHWRQQRQPGGRGTGLRLRQGGFRRVCAAVLRVST